jgi:flagellar protein FlgJ
MGISPSTDLIIDVMRQADPVRAREAAERLNAVGRTGAANATAKDFAAHVTQAIAETPVGTAATAVLPSLQGRPLQSMPLEVAQAGPGGVRPSGKMSPAEELEAFVLTSLVETMMPKDAESVFGSGTAGAYWRSMLAEKLAAELTMAGGVGLREQLGLGDTGKPDEPTEMLKAVLGLGKTSSQAALATSDAIGLGSLGARAISQALSHADELETAEPESYGAEI